MRVDHEELIARARALIGYCGKDRQWAAATTGVKESDVTVWFESRREDKYPGIEQLVLLAEAAGVPRLFAERGFEPLREPAGLVGELQERVSRAEAAREQLQAALDQYALEVTARLDALQGQVVRLQRRQQQ